MLDRTKQTPKRCYTVDEKATIRNQMGKERIKFGRHKKKNSKKKKPRGQLFSVDGHQAILHKMNKNHRQIESGRKLTIKIKHNRSTALDWQPELKRTTIKAKEGHQSHIIGHQPICRDRHRLWGPSYRRAITEQCIISNPNWVRVYACCLSHNLPTILYSSVTIDNIFELFNECIS